VKQSVSRILCAPEGATGRRETEKYIKQTHNREREMYVNRSITENQKAVGRKQKLYLEKQSRSPGNRIDCQLHYSLGIKRQIR
jgi:hypothetical protein